MPVQDGVVGLVHLAHRAAAELADDPVFADPLAIHAVTAGPLRGAGGGRTGIVARGGFASALEQNPEWFSEHVLDAR